MNRIQVHRVLAASLTALALLAGVVQVGWFLTGQPPPPADPGYIPRQLGYGLFVLGASGLGGVVLSRAPSRRHLSLFAMTLSLMGLPLLSDGTGPALVELGVPEGLFPVLASLGFFLALAALYRLSRSFPLPLPLGRAGPWGEYGPWLAAFGAWGAVWIGALPLTPRLGMAMALAVAVVGLLNWRRMYRAADGDGRRRILWLVQGLAAFSVVAGLQVALVVLVQTTPLSIPIPGWEYWLRLVALFAALAFLAVAVFYSGALDPGLVLRRTALYGFSGVALVFLFTAIEDLSAGWLASRLGLGEKAGSWLAGGVVALLLAPLHAALTRATGSRG